MSAHESAYVVFDYRKDREREKRKGGKGCQQGDMAAREKINPNDQPRNYPGNNVVGGRGRFSSDAPTDAPIPKKTRQTFWRAPKRDEGARDGRCCV
jgi:hypothetical protein